MQFNVAMKLIFPFPGPGMSNNDCRCICLNCKIWYSSVSVREDLIVIL